MRKMYLFKKTAICFLTAALLLSGCGRIADEVKKPGDDQTEETESSGKDDKDEKKCHQQQL